MLNLKLHALFLIFGVPASMTAAHHELQNRNLMAGSENYQEHCASCHGVNLEGQPNWREYKADGSLPAPPHDETGHTWHHDTKMLFEYTKFGHLDGLKNYTLIKTNMRRRFLIYTNVNLFLYQHF